MPVFTVPVRRVDARGRLCPLPTLLASLNLENMGSGDVLELRADDPITRQDFPAWCREFGHDLADIREETGSFVFTVLKK